MGCKMRSTRAANGALDGAQLNWPDACVNTPSVLDRTIAGRAAWTRADVHEQDYRVTLSERARRELLQTAEAMRRQPVPLLALRSDSFDMPACRAAMEEVRAILRDGVRFALLPRLPMEERSLAGPSSLQPVEMAE